MSPSEVELTIDDRDAIPVVIEQNRPSLVEAGGGDIKTGERKYPDQFEGLAE